MFFPARCGALFRLEVSRFTTTEAPHWEPQQVQIKHRDTSSRPITAPRTRSLLCLFYYPLSVCLSLSLSLPFVIHLSTHFSLLTPDEVQAYHSRVITTSTFAALHPKAPEVWLAEYDGRPKKMKLKTETDRERKTEGGEECRRQRQTEKEMETV